MTEEKINFSSIEKKWQDKWEQEECFVVKDNENKQKYYVLEMYPYPSASFLHMGHVRNYTIGDVYARYMRMKGFSVLYPMGYDSFGLPAETAAKKQGIHPKKYTEDAIKTITQYFKALGNSYDWSKTLSSHEPEYYKWNQFFFLKLFEKGLAYRKKAPINWCEKCQSVLANEEAEGGKCWRCAQDVIKKDMEQWFFKITGYADRLLEDLNKINWPEKIKIMQKNWIGKSYGSEILFEINNEKWPVFTTRPDTLFGVTFMVISAQHPRLFELVTKEQKSAVEEFVKKLSSVKESDIDTLEKEGVFTGSFAYNPINNEKVPVYAGNFVLADYGCGMVMAVPAHDQRDFEFANKYKIPIKQVIGCPKEHDWKKAYTDKGNLVNSREFNDLDNQKAKDEITAYLEKKGLAKKTVNYKIRDWMISRQRYWGTPIPIIYCEKCGVVPVPEKDLPVLLPEEVDFNSNVTNPLMTNKDFINVSCPKCFGKAKRETDTMGGFMDSSWYFLRYCDNKNNEKPFDEKKVNHWMPVDQYIGGAEHAVMHLMYSRFFIKALKDLGYIGFEEPFMKLFNQGIVYKDGAKMSKSLGNVVYQTDISNKYGIDTARIFLMSVASPDKQMEWNENGIEGSFRTVNKLFRAANKIKNKDADEKIQSKLNITIKNVDESIKNFEYPKALISLNGFLDYLDSEEEISKEAFIVLLKLISPFCPHVSEEIWEKIGEKGFISLSSWPVCNESKINLKLEEEEKAVDKLGEDINNILKMLKDKGGNSSEGFIYTIPPEKNTYKTNIPILEKKTGIKIQVFAVNDSDKIDPESKSNRAKPGKPAIYLKQ